MAEGAQPDLSSDLYALVVYLHASCNRDLLDAIAHEQLSFSQLQLLERLRSGRRRPTITQAAAMMHVSQAAASRNVDGLARRGLVLREVDDDNFRTKRLVITERGEQAIARLHAVRLAQIDTFTAQLAPDERDQLRATLTKLLEREQIAAYRPQPAAA
jgi:DNA-binding MarR family transcriptional regulator